MSALIGNLNSAFTSLFGLVYAPLAALGPFWSLTIFSVAAGLMMLWVFRLVSDQDAIAERKRKIQANLIAVRLFQNNFHVFLRIQSQILVDVLFYMRLSIKPALVMVIPVFLILVQLDSRYSSTPIVVGEAVILKVKLADSSTLTGSNIYLEAGGNITVETAPLRIPLEKEVAWRIRPQREGDYQLKVHVDDHIVIKKLHVGSSKLFNVPARRVKGLLELLVNPGESPIDSKSKVESVTISSPSREVALSSWKINWVVLFLSISIATGFLFKGLFGVHI